MIFTATLLDIRHNVEVRRRGVADRDDSDFKNQKAIFRFLTSVNLPLKIKLKLAKAAARPKKTFLA